MVKLPSAGSLHERIAFEARAPEDDQHGNVEGDFVEQFQRRAGFTFLRGGEAVIAARLEGRQPVVVLVRSDSETRLVDTDWQMRDVRTSKVYAVKSIIPSDDRQWLHIAVESGVAS
ncbi:phage head completion protein [Agrobacterium tumefaciens]|uniref:phage head completion protein n=1 Tax=Agrobacterium tumefaciens TaxID=358 RepID=UPI003BA353E7